MSANSCWHLARSSLLGAVFAAALTAPVAAQQCNPAFGDQIYEWVNIRVPAQSRGLAAADLTARAFNFVLLASEDLNARVNAAAERFDHIDRLIATSEATPATGVLAGALRRDDSATQLLNELYALRSDLDGIGRRRTALMVVPTIEVFRLRGLHNVGRATLLASLQELGDARQASLSGRYSVFVSASFNENGELQDADVQFTPADMIDTIVLAAAAEGVKYAVISGPTAVAVVLIYKVGRFAWESETCRRRLEQQEERWNEAIKLLPERLIPISEQFGVYERAYAAARVDFAPYLPSLDSAVTALDQRWRELFAYNALRQQAASAVLTSARVEQLRREYEQGGPIARIFNEVALIDLARDVGRVNSYLATGQLTLLSACGDLQGFVSAEDQTDALAFAGASLAAFRARPEFAPLHRLLETSLESVDEAATEAARVSSRLRTRSCSSEVGHGAALLTLAAEAGTRWMPVPQRAQGTQRTGRLLRTARAMPLATPLVASGGAGVGDQTNAVTPSQWGPCILYRSGRAHFCAAQGSSGSPYSNQFGNSTGNPGQDVLGSAHDGGYATDNRRVADEIAAISSNVEDRITSVRVRLEAAAAALPQWIEGNRSFIEAHRQSMQTSLQSTRAAREAFAASHTAEVAHARAAIETFTREPIDPHRTTELVRQVGGTAFSLPNLRDDAVVPGMPTLSGISAAERVYGSSANSTRMLLERERLKSARMAPGPAMRAASNALRSADRFVDADPRYAHDLLRDAQALRLWASGSLDRLELSVVSDDGGVSRRLVTNPDSLPPDALISRVRRMDAGMTLFLQRSGAIRSTIAQGQATGEQIRAVNSAEKVAAAAETSFFSGDLIDGEMLLRLASGILDIATSLTPGISWGRDVYEAIAGKDLFSDEELGVGLRTAAIIGAMSGGIGDKPLDVLRTIRRITDAGASAADAERAVDLARNIDHMGVGMLDHAVEQAANRGIDQDLIDNAIDLGQPWWVVDKGTIAMIGEDVVDGGRVVATVDPRNRVVTTVYTESRADEALASITLDDGRKRFIRIPVEH